MNPLERWCLHAATLLAGATGLLYGWFRYFGQRAGDFGPEPHPLQGPLQHAHVLVCPLLVFALGLLFRAHVLAKLRSGQPSGRRSGWLLVLTALPMVLAGYGIQVVLNPGTRTLLAWIHGLGSLAFLLGWGAHIVRARLAASREFEAARDPD